MVIIFPTTVWHYVPYNTGDKITHPLATTFEADFSQELGECKCRAVRLYENISTRFFQTPPLSFTCAPPLGWEKIRSEIHPGVCDSVITRVIVLSPM